MRNIKRITEVMKIWNCKRALGLLKQIYRENLFSAVLSLTVIVLLAVVGVMPSFLIGKIIDMAAAGRIDGLFMLNVGLILALGGGKILEITQEYITAESGNFTCSTPFRYSFSIKAICASYSHIRISIVPSAVL